MPPQQNIDAVTPIRFPAFPGSNEYTHCQGTRHSLDCNYGGRSDSLFTDTDAFAVLVFHSIVDEIIAQPVKKLIIPFSGSHGHDRAIQSLIKFILVAVVINLAIVEGLSLLFCGLDKFRHQVPAIRAGRKCKNDNAISYASCFLRRYFFDGGKGRNFDFLECLFCRRATLHSIIALIGPC